MSVCTVSSCTKRAKARGWCETHYSRWKVTGDPTKVKQIQGFDAPRLMEKVEMSANGCWLWRGALTQSGYGQFRYLGKTSAAHRASYQIHRGPIPTGMTLDHLCRQRSCVNPDHLEAVDQRENLLRGNTIPAANAAKTRCVNGHEFTVENTYSQPDRGGRHCRACRKAQRRLHFERTGR